MKSIKKVFTLCLCLAMLSATSIAGAANVSIDKYSPNFVDVLTPTMSRGASLPTEAFNLANGAYNGRITNIGSLNGVYTNYYFTANQKGELTVSATLTASSPQSTAARCTFEIFDVVKKTKVSSYLFDAGQYNNKYLVNKFTGLNPSTAYAVRFYNSSSTTYNIDLQGPVSVYWP